MSFPRRRAASAGSVAFVVSIFASLVLLNSAHADSRAALPASAAGFKMTKPVQVFNPGTLENHIDGQAESVKRYQFRQCDYAEYAPGGRGNQLITVDLYEMGSPLDAFGYYSFQLSPSARSVKYVPIGAQGYQTRDSLNFWKGSNYVVLTITAANAPASFQAALPKIGQAIAAKLTGTAQKPAMLNLLPAGYTPHSEKYQRSDIAGQQFLVNGVTAAYPAAGAQSELFIASYPSPGGAKQAYQQYAAYLNKPMTLAMGAKPTPLKGVGESGLAVRTRFGGQVVTAVKGRYVIGIRKARDVGAAQRLVAAAAARAH